MLPFASSEALISNSGMPLNSFYSGQRAQSLYYADDLRAAGLMRGGTIYSIGIKVFEPPGFILNYNQSGVSFSLSKRVPNTWFAYKNRLCGWC